MDLEVALLIGAAVVGIVVGVLHLVGYVPPRYRKMLKAIQADTAKALGEAIDARLALLMPTDDPDAPDPLGGLREALASLPGAITQGVREAMPELPAMPDLSTLPRAIAVELGAMLSAAQEDAMAQLKDLGGGAPIPQEVAGAIGGLVTQDRRKDRELTEAIGQGLLGPYGAILEHVFPPLYDYLVANPDMVVRALEMPVVQKLIQQGARAVGGLKVGETSLEEVLGRVVR